MKAVKIEKLKPRRKPLQDRSIARASQIMDVTAELMEKVGFNDLTTILIAKELGISVGSLYHYFPNKQSILRAIAKNWLQEWALLLDKIDALPLEQMSIESLVDTLLESFVALYREQRGILPLVQAMFSVPELKDLDLEHDELVISRMSRVFTRVGLKKSKNELSRIARAYLEMTHALLLVVSAQHGLRSKRTLEDLRYLTCSFLRRHFENG